MIEPTLPKSIKKQRSIHDTVLKEDVMPTVRPTVAIAEIVSNNASIKGIESIWEMITAELQAKKRYNIKIHAAVLVKPSSNLLPKASVDFL